MDARIEGVVIRPVAVHADARGWLCECFRRDELPPDLVPAMAYVSVTLPGATRGPHEHREQTDSFIFPGPSDFRLYLWDNRPDSPTFGAHVEAVVGASNPCAVVLPPGIAHAYKNIGDAPALVFNAPNRLYRGEGKRGPADEIRYENVAGAPFAVR